ncbi:MAG: hypothetical protein ACKOFO_11155, partial [Gemmatimonadota bacterium]
VYRANHGQWNTVWGDNDVGEMGRWLAKRSLLQGEEQRDVGRIFFPGFLELALRGDRRYEPMFRDHRTVGAWLPRTLYVSQFASGGERRIATFEEDIDVTTATAGGAVAARGLTLWREGNIPTRATTRGATFETTAVYLGWSAPKDSTAAPDPDRAWYEVALPAEAMGPEARLTFSLAQLALRPGPLSVRDTLTPDTAAVAGSAGRDSSASRARASRSARARTAAEAASRARLPADSLRVDLSVELLTHDGRRATVPLSEVVALRPPLTIRLYRHASIESRVTGSPRDHEYALQRVEIPFACWACSRSAPPPSSDSARRRWSRSSFSRITDKVGKVEDGSASTEGEGPLRATRCRCRRGGSHRPASGRIATAPHAPPRG